MCEAGSERSLDPTAPARTRRVGGYIGFGGSQKGGVKWSYNLSLTSPSAQAGRPVGCCRKRFPLPASLLAHRWIGNSLGEEGKQKSHLYFEIPFGMYLGFVPLGSPDSITLSCGKSLLLCQWLLWPLPRQCQFATCSLPPSSSLFCTTHVTAAAFALNVSCLWLKHKNRCQKHFLYSQVFLSSLTLVMSAQ